jgi:hypothetical protein
MTKTDKTDIHPDHAKLVEKNIATQQARGWVTTKQAADLAQRAGHKKFANVLFAKLPSGAGQENVIPFAHPHVDEIDTTPSA